MMKCCCFIVLIFCTIDVSNGGILSGMCHASNGTCGKKGVPCNQTFGSEWTYTGKCCNERPCCKFLKPPCVPETCPEGYRLLPNQASNTNCYVYKTSALWETAQSICASTPGANLWNPNTEQEANNVYQEFLHPIGHSSSVWTGANDRDGDGTYTFYKENGSFSKKSLPFGTDLFTVGTDRAYVSIQYSVSQRTWYWTDWEKIYSKSYICEYQRRVCP
ncbi:uncharacterized protein [Mytilus edulis]|uniref:uncharacterized protein n=1 Tax=Mytilus edulis TaxID=6550 RepID=UPI0039EE222F